VSGEESEPWAENQERRLRLLLPLGSSCWMSLVDLRLVMSLEKLRRFIEFLLVGEVSSEVMAVPGWGPPTPKPRPGSLDLDFCRCKLTGIGGMAGMSSSSESSAPPARKLNLNEFLLRELLEDGFLCRLNRRLERFVFMSVASALLSERRRSGSNEASGRQ
jgi:hypothetical protein